MEISTDLGSTTENNSNISNTFYHSSPKRFQYSETSNHKQTSRMPDDEQTHLSKVPSSMPLLPFDSEGNHVVCLQ